ncbi:hypothetical protein [Pedobacter heparinus]|uniref:Right handed beta helix domain-containing protein n=1 Tax=Pedobacter heparinus (strain ATCC 13125 / DSM 2366 / CIP 104194 / JCM 7457 / NBRC 12017 / NCIMB 9290 / NRRL B-14731 / HIM 762-3) TaxID=485917 RepID=C6XSW7_PEDHD|nr:hypothetical protein [Pedobacter heparinus]ACU03528.1 hypothetical protein Phep_1313 [Pedobacter heparinus DSM 2366]
MNFKNLLFYFLMLAAIPAAATNYYINSKTGSDNNAGNSKDRPWKTMVNLGKNKFMPGDSILFARGSAYTGGVIFSSSGNAAHPIVISHYSVGADVIKNTPRTELTPIFEKYGAGPAPAFSNPDWNVLNGNIFRIEGSYVVIDGLYFHDNTNPPGSDKTTKNVQKLGAVYLALGTHHQVVKNCEFFHTPVGIKVKSIYSLITRNHFHDAANMMAYSWGPIAIMVVSGNNEISHNRVENYGAYGGPYGSDGGVIELDGVDDNFKANNIHIHHNTSINNHGFLEIAARNVDSVTVAYNLSDDRNQFIGGGGYKVNVFNNTVVRTREPNVDRYVFWTFNPELTFFNVKNNIFYIASDLGVFGPVKKVTGHVRVAIGEQPREQNLYYSPGNENPIGITARKGDLLADPLFIDLQNRNFRLSAKSPALGKGTKTNYTYDLDGYPVKNTKPALGAYEF